MVPALSGINKLSNRPLLPLCLFLFNWQSRMQSEKSPILLQLTAGLAALSAEAFKSWSTFLLLQYPPWVTEGPGNFLGRNETLASGMEEITRRCQMSKNG